MLQRRRRQRHFRRHAVGSAQAENPLLGLAELLGYTGDDPGHWNYSPEWWGNQDGSWGRDAGVTVFAADSSCGNGRVTVTAHPASLKGQPSSSSGDACSDGSGSSWEEWRVLRFNGVTRQTVMRVRVGAGGTSSGSGSGSSLKQTLVAQPDCLAQEYLKTAAAVTAGLLGLQQLFPSRDSGGSGKEQRRLRALCIGVGGGSFPFFLAHHFPSMGELELFCYCRWLHPLHSPTCGASLTALPHACSITPVSHPAPAPASSLPFALNPNSCTSLPLPLASAADIDAVELDPAVVAAATEAMGLPTGLPNLRLHTADAAAFLEQQQQAQQEQQRQGRRQQEGEPYDLVFMDAFDGEDAVPAALCTPGAPRNANDGAASEVNVRLPA